MRAKQLREAARLLREKAALPYVDGSWEASSCRVRRQSNSRVRYPAHLEAAVILHDDKDALAVSRATAEFVATMDPTLARAVADWLEVTAADAGTSSLTFHGAAHVAAAILGSAS